MRVLRRLAVALRTGFSLGVVAAGVRSESAETAAGQLEKLIVASGSAPSARSPAAQLGEPAQAPTRPSRLRFDLERDSFLTVLVFNGELRGPLPGSVRLVAALGSVPGQPGVAPALVVERPPGAAPFELVVRDADDGLRSSSTSKGHELRLRARGARRSRISGGRLLLSPEFANGARASGRGRVGRRDHLHRRHHARDRGRADRRRRDPRGVLPAMRRRAASRGRTSSSGTSTAWRSSAAAAGRRSASPWARTRATPASMNLNWFALPSNDHPVIPQNLYRMSGGPTNDRGSSRSASPTSSMRSRP